MLLNSWPQYFVKISFITQLYIAKDKTLIFTLFLLVKSVPCWPECAWTLDNNILSNHFSKFMPTIVPCYPPNFTSVFIRKCSDTVVLQQRQLTTSPRSIALHLLRFLKLCLQLALTIVLIAQTLTSSNLVQIILPLTFPQIL